MRIPFTVPPTLSVMLWEGAGDGLQCVLCWLCKANQWKGATPPHTKAPATPSGHGHRHRPALCLLMSSLVVPAGRYVKSPSWWLSDFSRHCLVVCCCQTHRDTFIFILFLLFFTHSNNDNATHCQPLVVLSATHCCAAHHGLTARPGCPALTVSDTAVWTRTQVCLQTLPSEGESLLVSAPSCGRGTTM